MAQRFSTWLGVAALLLGGALGACGDGAAVEAPADAVDAVDALADVGADTLVTGDAGDADDTADSAAPDDADDTAIAEDSGGDDVAEDTAGEDSAPGDAADTDTDTDAVETVPTAGFGAISGDCGVIDTELADPGPTLFVNHIDFGDDPYDAADLDLLTDGGQAIIAAGNAGGSSLYSEVFAYELLARCELATLLKTETTIEYVGDGKITDLLVEIDGEKVGVSVTRAVAFPFDSTYTEAQAKSLLEKKLGDILLSSGHVAESDRWVKQILSVVAYGDQHAAAIESAWASIDAAVRADTIVIVTVSDGDDAFLY
ncbi:MAG: hypothetical protein H6745_23385 [Deltaproteobacteria bacterium]|nr:hypothetical protein [Deltaproteobacteria bacterium]